MWRLDNNLQESVIFFLHVGSRMLLRSSNLVPSTGQSYKLKKREFLKHYVQVVFDF